jgi:hypothetical protein
MTCRDFERFWQERLDNPGAEFDVGDQALERHASTCPRCREQGNRYQALRLALKNSPSSMSRVSDDFPRRVLAEHSLAMSRARRFVSLVKLAAAAAILTALGTLVLRHRERPSGPPTLEPQLEAVPTRPLAQSLSDLTDSTLVLARQTSEPAARLGLNVLLSAPEFPGEPDSFEAGPVAPEHSDFLEEWGERVGEEMRPLSGSARRAFSFLFGPAPPDDREPREG